MLDQLDQAIRSAATEFVEAIFADGWRGREREAVSLFAIGYLIRHCRPDSVLHSPTQIAIEAAVPGVPELNPKGRVNKDLVIWPRPAQTCWDEAWKVVHDPLAVLEWKVFRPTTGAPSASQYDLNWLARFSQGRSNFVGYAVWLDLARRGSRLEAARVHEGAVEAKLAAAVRARPRSATPWFDSLLTCLTYPRTRANPIALATNNATRYYSR